MSDLKYSFFEKRDDDYYNFDNEFYVEYDKDNGLNLFDNAMSCQFYNEFGIELSGSSIMKYVFVSVLVLLGFRM